MRKLAFLVAIFILIAGCSGFRSPDGIPSYWMNTEGIPPVGDQVVAGSCYAWAAAYYYLTHLQWRDYGWDVKDPAHQCSPGFVYDLTNGGVDDGAWRGENARADAFSVFQTLGCASMAAMPYAYTGFLTYPSETAFREAMRFRTRATRRIDVQTDEGIRRLKAHLSTGDLAVLGIYGYANLTGISRYGDTYCVKQVSGPRLFWHDIALVGYDDGKKTADGRGAFRAVNSWGENWGDRGYFWISYGAVKGFTSCGYALYAEDLPRYEPRLIARIGLDYPDRYDLVLKVGVAGSDAKTIDFFAFHPMSIKRDIPFPKDAVSIDITDAITAPVDALTLAFRFEDRVTRQPIAPKVYRLEIENRVTGARVGASQSMIPDPSGVIEIDVPKEGSQR